MGLSYNDKLRTQTLWYVGLRLHGLCRAAEPVRSSRLQTFLTVLNFNPLSG